MQLPDDGVVLMEMSVSEARDFNPEGMSPPLERLLTALDEAQAMVFTGERTRSFIVIEISD